MLKLSRLVVGGCFVSLLLAASEIFAAEEKGKAMSYGDARALLAKYTQIIELTDDAGGRVAVAPQWQGRVMTSTCGGLKGPSFGFINRAFIEAGKPDERFNNYGAEDRFWLCPEGGQFSLWFKPGAKQTLDNWHTPPAMDAGAWQVLSKPGEPSVKMAAQMKLENASAASFELDVAREVRLLGAGELRELFGEAAAEIIGQVSVKSVGYETINQITNRGPDFDRNKGLVSIWILGMFNCGPQSVVIAPYKPGTEAELGSVVKFDYFGAVPPERLKVTPQAVLFRADGKCRSKIGLSQTRARNVLGSVDFEAGVLTLVHFTMPDQPAKHLYLNNAWVLPQEKPYSGDVSNAYNDGPNELGSQLGAFYEIESISPARELKTGESLAHRHRTIHVQADMDTLRRLAKEVLGVELDDARQALPE